MSEKKGQSNKKPIETLCVQGVSHHVDSFGAVVAPLYTTTTYRQVEPGKPQGGFDYIRGGNPTQSRLEATLAGLESATHGLVFSSGLSAIDAVLRTLSAGDIVLVCDDVYGGTQRLMTRLHDDKQFEYWDMTNIPALSKRLQSEPDRIKLIWVESLTNPLLRQIDVGQVALIAKQYDIKVAVDNTFLTPFYQQPLQLGADLVMHSATKYLGGHSDVLMGALMTSDVAWYKQLKFIQFGAGAVPSPRDCAQMSQHLQTFHLRMPAHEHNAQVLHQRLSEHPAVDHSEWRGSGMISVRLHQPINDYSVLCVFQLAESLGAVESLINLPQKMTHASLPREKQVSLGIDECLIRLSVGLENVEDLWADLKRILG